MMMLMEKHQNYVRVNVECSVGLKLKEDKSIVKSVVSFKLWKKHDKCHHYFIKS